MNKFYITTAIPYVNGRPHIGHTLEYFQADTVRRYHDLLGEETLLLSGADENALKNVQAAEKEGLPIQEFLDKYSQIWKDIYEFVGVHLDVFQRGSDQEKHWPGVQKLWKLCEESGDIYKKSYSGLYCVGCESFKTEAELVDGLCPEHQTKPELVTEENYFFRLSKYQDKLVQLIEENEFKITPANKRAEALSFIKSGLQDFSVSRSNERSRGVGVPVPGDDSQKIYVWFDALNIYITGVGFGTDEEKFAKWWPADLHVIGKDINRFHTVYWPAMLLSAGIPLPREILIHSFVYAEGGQKMSKSIGNVIDPYEVVKELGLEPVRYYMLSQIPLDADGDFTQTRFKEVYNADLANNIGNLVSRVAKLCEDNDVEITVYSDELDPGIKDLLGKYDFVGGLQLIQSWVTELNREINDKKPWELPKESAQTLLQKLAPNIQKIGFNLKPFLPETSEKILKQFTGNIKIGDPLFPRIS
ncbi:MAG: methionine--tRNA ligase [bacterium]|nr:methionine--tRNA ligase [bacterium]